MAISFLAALLRGIAKVKGEPAPHVPRGAKGVKRPWSPEPVKEPELPPVPTPEAKPPEPDEWWKGLEEPEPTPDFPRTPIDGFMRFGHWLDCSHSTNVEAIRWKEETQELDVVYQEKGKRNGSRAWTYGSITSDLAYEFATVEALDITPLGNPSTSGKGVRVWDHILIRGRGNQGKHQVPARPNPGLVAEWETFRTNR